MTSTLLQLSKMADIRFLVEDIDDREEDQDDEGCDMDQDDPSILDQITPEELLSPIIRMEKYMHSDVIFNRQMAARYIREALNACRSKEDVYHVLRVVVRLSEDIEPCVRVELMEQIPHVALFCYEHYSLMEAVPQYILYIILRYLMDSNNQVRKTSQHVLLELLKHELVERADIEDQICPVLMQLTAGDSSDDYRSEAVTLMSKMAPLVGPGITEKYFVPRFEVLCSDTLFHVRKVCASTFGEICNVVGPELTTDRLLPVFFRLCQDGVWGVRKSCAESFMSVSSSCPEDVRTIDLADVFVNLLCDKSRWVQMAAYQNLGPFISTFADPQTSGFYIDEDGSLCPLPKQDEIPTRTEAETTENTATTNVEEKEKELNQRERGSSPETNTTDSGYISPPELHTEQDHHQPKDSKDLDELHSCTIHTEQDHHQPKDSKDLDELHSCTREFGKCIHCPTTDLDDDVDEKYFNSFLFWRNPLPQVEIDITEINSGQSKEKDNEDKAEMYHNMKETDKDDGNDVQQSTTDKPSEDFRREGDHSDSEEELEHPLFSLTDDLHDGFDYSDYHKMKLQHSTSFEEELLLGDHLTPLPKQNVIPQALLDHYISMTEPSKAQTIDTEIARHCAFSFPAVTLTLGRHNWPCLRDTYEYLSSDMQWKVRRTLAFSIHELAKVLGEEMTRLELVPTFNSFLKDLDEVRIGVLKHLADFIELLPVDIRMDYLPVLVDFLTTDNNRNWRFRHELAEQLMRISVFYNGNSIQQYVSPIAITLATDRVADVRSIAFKLIGVLLRRLHIAKDEVPARKFVSDIIVKFANSQQWTRRQAYTQLCHTLLEDDAESGGHFCKEFLPSLLTLLSDKIPNVRLSVARTLNKNVLNCEYLCSPDCKEKAIIETALQKLQGDIDRDVRYFAGAPDILDHGNHRKNSLATENDLDETADILATTVYDDADNHYTEDDDVAGEDQDNEPITTHECHESNPESHMTSSIENDVINENSEVSSEIVDNINDDTSIESSHEDVKTSEDNDNESDA